MKPVPDSNGNVSLTFPSGEALVNVDSAAQLSLTPDTTNDNHLAVKLTRADGTGPIAVTTMGGTFGGSLAARDGALKTAQTSIDQLAFDWGNTVNTVHAAGYALDGSTGRNLFNVSATATGAAASISVNAAINADPSLIAAASAPGAQGDNTNLQTLIGTENTALSTGASVLDGWSGIVSSYGTTTQQVISKSDADTAVFQHVTSLRDATSGVSTDEEMINLQKAQRGYEAVMKVITTANDMLTTLMTLTTTT